MSVSVSMSDNNVSTGSAKQYDFGQVLDDTSVVDPDTELESVRTAKQPTKQAEPTSTRLDENSPEYKELLRRAESMVVQRMLLDPDVKALYDAKATGKRVKIIPLRNPDSLDDTDFDGSRRASSSAGSADFEDSVGATNAQASELDLSKIDFDNMSNKDIVALIQKYTASQISKLAAQLRPIKQSVEYMQQKYINERNQELTKQIEDARKEFKDFDQYESDMVRIYKDNRNLSPRQLYILAKLERGLPIMLNSNAQPNPESERPTPTSARPFRTNPEEAKAVLGPDGFRNALRAAIDRTIT